jgi:hypothetical protein
VCLERQFVGTGATFSLLALAPAEMEKQGQLVGRSRLFPPPVLQEVVEPVDVRRSDIRIGRQIAQRIEALRRIAAFGPSRSPGSAAAY